MSIKLKDIASVQMGMGFKNKVENLQSSDNFVVQMKDLTEDNEIDFSTLYGIDPSFVKEKHLIRKDDILFRSRGKNNTAVMVKEKIENIAVASPLIRIRCSSTIALPSYVCWLINHPSSQSFFLSMAKVSSVQMIDKKTLEDFKIIMPNVETQKAIAELDYLAKKEQKLLNELSLKKQLYIDTLLMQMAQKGS
jgi:restriction endonuclease S subunit